MELGVRIPLISLTWLPRISGSGRGEQNISRPVINFFHFIRHFQNLLAKVRAGIDRVVSVVGTGVNRTVARTQEIFYRLIYPRDFNLLDHFDSEHQNLKNYLDHLGSKFLSSGLIVGDLKELERISLELGAALSQLENFIEGQKEKEVQTLGDRALKLKEHYLVLGKQLETYLSHKDNLHLIRKTFNIAVTDWHKISPRSQERAADLIQGWQILEELLKEHCPESLLEVKKIVEDEDVDLSETHRLASKPPSLPNVGNSCYIASALQLVLTIGRDKMRRILSKPLPKDQHLDGKLSIQRELMKFTYPSIEDHANRSYLDSLAILLNLKDTPSSCGPSLSRFRKAMFDSGLHVELESGRLYDQLDAASVAELLFSDFLPYKFNLQSRTKTKVFPGMEFIYRAETMPMVQVEFHDQERELGSLLRHALNARTMKGEESARIFDPNNRNIDELNQRGSVAQVIDPKLVAAIPHEPKLVQEYERWERFTELPEVIPLHFKRFELVEGNRLRKIDTKIEFPKDGIVDLKEFCSFPSGEEPKNTRYEIVGYVEHRGELNGGHYFAYVKRDEYYWKCNDGSITQIEKEQFLNSSPVIEKDGQEIYDQDKDKCLTKAYLVLLKRLSDSDTSAAAPLRK